MSKTEATRVTHSPDETLETGARLGAAAAPGCVIALFGGLGAGKTVLVKGIMAGMGGDPATVTSPTFTLMIRHDARIPLYHFDAYRLTGMKDLQEIGAEEAFYSDGLSVIEWAERAMGILPKDRVNIYISVIDSNERLLSFEAGGPKSESFLKAAGILA